jgi:hypothetical protein
MGAMILLLAIVAMNVREQPGTAPPAAAKVAETIEPTVNEPDTLKIGAKEAVELLEQIKLKAEEAEWFAQNLAKVKKEAAEKLAENQTKLAIAEKETQKVHAEIRRLEKLAEQLDSSTKTDPAELAKLKQLLDQKKQRRQQAELELAELQKEAANNSKSYAIIPYRGANGTFRRPIYIECLAGKIIIQPEGIELTEADFQTANRPDNPFDTVLRVIRQYYMETNQIVRGSEPYPLIIIRPSGVEMYDKVRQAVGSWVKDFGYELVNEDWNVQYPEPSDELQSRMNVQLEVARNRMTGYIVAMKAAERANRMERGGRHYRFDNKGNVIPVDGSGMPETQSPARRTHDEPGTMPPVPTAAHVPQVEGTLAPAYTSQQRDDSPNTSAKEQAKEPPGTEQRQSQPQPPQQSSPQPDMQMKQQPMEGKSSKGENWALKGATPFSAAVSRSVKIRCEEDKFTLVQQPGLIGVRVVPITESVYSAAEKLVQVIQEFEESWGIAGEKMYWKPILKVQVVPGGERRFQELKALLRESGMVIEEAR